jgi:hypothetical protein
MMMAVYDEGVEEAVPPYFVLRNLRPPPMFAWHALSKSSTSPPHLDALNATYFDLNIGRQRSTSTEHQFVIETHKMFLTESPVRKFGES